MWPDKSLETLGAPWFYSVTASSPPHLKVRCNFAVFSNRTPLRQLVQCRVVNTNSQLKFNPKKLAYGKGGVPILRAAEIEAVATELLERYCPEVLAKPCFAPVIEIIDQLRERTNLKFLWGDFGKKVLGAVNFERRVLLLDASLETERKQKMRFTAAHEIGHWVLHRHRKLVLDNRLEATGAPDLEDDERSLCRLETRTPRDWLEYQANVFAANLVMPRATFNAAVVGIQKRLGMTKNFGMVFLSNNRFSQKDFSEIVSSLVLVYDVSRQSVEVRLRTLKLVVEQTPQVAKQVIKSIASK